MSQVTTLPYARDARLSPTWELLRLAMPMIGVTVSRMLMGFIDFVMVSELGTAAQAAVSPATLFVFAIGCIGMGISQSVQTYVSQADGRGEPQRCGGYAWQSFYIAAIYTLLTAPIVLTTDQWFGWLAEKADHPPEIRGLEIDYLRIALWSIGPSIVCMGLENFFNGIKRPRVGLIAVIASLVFNGIGNYALIYGKFGFPRMGIAGAALATVLAWLVRAAVLSAALLGPEIARRYNTRHSMGFDARKMLDLLRVGGPTAAQWLIDIGAWVVFLQVIMPPLGTEAMAASNIAIQYMHLSFMPALGIGMALTTQVGNAIGAGKPELAFQRVRTGRRVIVGYMAAVAVLFLLAGRPVASLLCFETDVAVRDAVLAATVQILIWVALFQVSDALCITYSFALRGAGDTRVPALLFGACCWIVFIGGGIAAVRLAPDWSFNGPWMMCTAYIVVLGVLLLMRFNSGAWRSIRLFDRAGVEADSERPIVEPPADTEETGLVEQGVTP